MTAALDKLGATLIRFLYGMPVSTLWLGLALAAGDFAMAALAWAFAGWMVAAAFGRTRRYRLPDRSGAAPI